MQRYFCKRCGIHCFARSNLAELGSAYISVDYNCLDGVELRELRSSTGTAATTTGAPGIARRHERLPSPSAVTGSDPVAAEGGATAEIQSQSTTGGTRFLVERVETDERQLARRH